MGLKYDRDWGTIAPKSALTGLDQLSVSPLRVLQVDCAVPIAYTFSQDPKVVAMEMHRMRGSGDV